MQRPNAQVFYEAKVLWEELRQKAISDVPTLASPLLTPNSGSSS